MQTGDHQRELLEQARKLVHDLESGRVEDANATLDCLTKLRETDLFQELGKLTRELHDTLANFKVDSRLSSLADSEIPDAKERLNHVITLTQQAADRTLTVVEQTLPRTERLEEKSVQLKTRWDRFRSRDMKVEEFRGLSQEIDEFLTWTFDNASLIHKGLSEVMMAQDFQDLTGQIIRRVITLVQDVEDNLVGIIRITGQRIKTPSKAEDAAQLIKAEGPAIPGLVDAKQMVGGQDDVDDLLSSLGF